MSQQSKLRSLRLWLVIMFAMLCFAEILGMAAAFTPPSPQYHGAGTFWQYQCIDTMKSSRDQARSWATKKNLGKLIDQQMSAIAATGANCVAIDTPYDAEFLPMLKAWVAGARAHHLMVWFRGNFSSWEGWFDYPQGMTEAELLGKTKSFIASNPDLFADNDIFTAAPEAENGGPFKQVDPANFQRYRTFLVTESAQTKAGFLAIHKHVTTNWDSMNGGLAMRMLDRPTVDQLGNSITIDHYVADPAGMGSFIDYLVHKFGSQVVVGEWGAPIPDINGAMTYQQQASFSRQLLQQMALRSKNVKGINYWTLSDGSTAIVDRNMKALPAFDVISSYYRPAVIKGTVKNIKNKPVANATVKVNNDFVAKTDRYGNFAMLVPSGDTTITVSAKGYTNLEKDIQLGLGSHITQDLNLAPQTH
jgi:hypothetical protein